MGVDEPDDEREDEHEDTGAEPDAGGDAKKKRQTSLLSRWRMESPQLRLFGRRPQRPQLMPEFVGLRVNLAMAAFRPRTRIGLTSPASAILQSRVCKSER
ncbi:unnamed protein product [Polarella glacialis]|uniref:Uncharacterized protein n=1 Tax=Polarella glacialis TaxID=89957 RepID=A0A813JAK0_POLGL|nr:unnamed protein product [Polarella glacialis]